MILPALPWGAVAHADATPTQIVLLYMPNVSTTGTPAASGIAELVLPEGEVRISATGLPRLAGSEQYVAWVVDTDANAFLRLGNFNTAQSTGAAHFEQVLPDPVPADRHWNLLLLTIEDSPTPARPGPRHSLAGLFPPSGSELAPELLPNTGGPAPDEPPANPRSDGLARRGRADGLTGQERSDWLATLGLAALTLVVGLGAGYAFGRR